MTPKSQLYLEYMIIGQVSQLLLTCIVAMEALFRLMWNAFVDWYTGNTRDDEERNVDKDALISKVEECRRAITARAEV